MPKLSLEDSARLVGHLQAGISPSKVANIIAVNETTVYRIMRNFEEEGTVKRKKGSGRSRTTSQEQDEEIVQAHENNPFLIPAKTASTFNVSAQTVRRRLREHGLKARKPASKPRLTQDHKEARMEWAVAHHRWTCAQWSRVLFTDEASFSVANEDGRFDCYRRQNERYAEGNIREHMN